MVWKEKKSVVLVSGRSFVFVFENVLLRFLANGATTKRDASPRTTTMMMERRDTQILSDLPPRRDVDDDDDASIVVVL